jgi:hypothetical protein
MHHASEAVLLRDFLLLLFRTVSSSIFHTLLKKCPGERVSLPDRNSVLGKTGESKRKKLEKRIKKGKNVWMIVLLKKEEIQTGERS